MSFSWGKMRGFKNDKRNILEATNNLVIFGEGQAPQEVVKGRRLLRRGGGNLRRPYSNKNGLPFPSSRKAIKSRSVPPTGPEAVEARTPANMRTQDILKKDLLVNYFSNTKPWMKNKSNPPEKIEESRVQAPTTATTMSKPATASKSKSTGKLKSFHSVESAIFANDIVCPICLKGFEPIKLVPNVPVSEMMKQSFAAYQLQSGMVHRKTLEEGWGSVNPRCVLEPQDVVVAANCGELFHKLCLREWCARHHTTKSPRTGKPVANCPSCGKDLKFTVFQEIECCRSFSEEPTALDKAINKTKHTHKELQLLWPQTGAYLAKIKQDIQDTKTVYNQLKIKRRSLKTELRKLTADDLSIVMNKVSSVGELRDALTKQEKALEFMEQESLQIMRMYLLTLVRKFKTGSAQSSSDNIMLVPVNTEELGKRIPETLIPHLNAILNDDHALALLSRIVAPKLQEDREPDSKKLLELDILKKYELIDKPPAKTDTYTVLSTNTSGTQLDKKLEPLLESLKSNNNGNLAANPPEIPATCCVASASTVPLLKVNSKIDVLQMREVESSASTQISDTMLSMLKTCSGSLLFPTKSGSDKRITRKARNPRRTYRMSRKPPKICKVVEIGESDILINPSANVSMHQEFQGEMDDSLQYEDMDRTSSMEVVATSVPPTAADTVPSGISELGKVESSGMQKEEAKGSSLNQSVEKDPPLVNLSEESSLKEIKSVRNSPIAMKICELVQGNNKLRREVEVHAKQRYVESADVFRVSASDSKSKAIRPAKSLGMINPSPKEKTSQAQEVIRESPPVTPTPTLPKKTEAESVEEIEEIEEIVDDDKSWCTILSDEEDNEELFATESISYSTGLERKIELKNPKCCTEGGSCQVVYSSGYQDHRLSTRPSPFFTPVQGKRSWTDYTTIGGGGRPNELSIAIMYIIEEDDEVEGSEADIQIDHDAPKNLKEVEDPGKILEPIYITADKTSNYSLIAAASSEGEEPIMEGSEDFHLSRMESYLQDGESEGKDSDSTVKDKARPLKDATLVPPRQITSLPTPGKKEMNGGGSEKTLLHSKISEKANLLFQNKFGSSGHEHIISLPSLSSGCASGSFPFGRKIMEPTEMFFENETLIKKRPLFFGKASSTK